jgi:hypothetical protein
VCSIDLIELSLQGFKLDAVDAEGDDAGTTGVGHDTGASMRWSRTAVLSLALVGALAAPVAAAQLSGQFSDVDPRNPHAEAIDWLASNDITKGCTPELFCGDDAVSRAQLASFLQRLATAGVVDAATVEGFTADELRGQQGERGERGEPGPTGAQGEKGETGETGAQGIQGEKGEQGIEGERGEDGNTVYGLEGTPGDELGRPGDLYLDTATITFYGPRTTEGWGEGVSLIGRDGLDGADGQDGQDGQDGANGQDGAQGAVGPQGERGLEGPAGPAGAPGVTGPEGPQGAPGAEGPQGPAGRDGVDGFGTPISAALDHGQNVVVAEQGQLQLVASCTSDGAQDRIELAFVGAEDGWIASTTFWGGEGLTQPAGSRVVVAEVTSSNGAPSYYQIIDRGHAMGPDGSYLAYQQETTALALNVFGRNCIVAGAAFGQQVDLAAG